MTCAWQIPASGFFGARPAAVDPRLIWAAVGLIGFILLGTLVIWWVDRWRKRVAQSQPFAGDQLADFRELYERGEISPEEFERIRNLLGKRLRQELNVPDSPPNQPPGPPAAGSA